MKIGIITGGVSGEREVSLASAKNIQKALAIPDELVFVFPEQKHAILVNKQGVDVYIPIIHGVGGEDGEIQQLLESEDIRCVFSGPDAHRTGLDKRASKIAAESAGLCVPHEFSPSEAVTFPCFAKPLFGGSSIDTALLVNQNELDEFFKNRNKRDYLVEQAIVGREFSVGVIEQAEGITALPVVEIITKAQFFDYESKYDLENGAAEVCPADIPDELAKQLQNQAVLIHQQIGARHISRSDFIVTAAREPYFLEINTIPGMTDTSIIPREIAAAGFDLSELLRSWCQDTHSKEE